MLIDSRVFADFVECCDGFARQKTYHEKIIKKYPRKTLFPVSGWLNREGAKKKQ